MIRVGMAKLHQRMKLWPRPAGSFIAKFESMADASGASPRVIVKSPGSF
jgi:hypothetical protein